MKNHKNNIEMQLSFNFTNFMIWFILCNNYLKKENIYMRNSGVKKRYLLQRVKCDCRWGCLWGLQTYNVATTLIGKLIRLTYVKAHSGGTIWMPRTSGWKCAIIKSLSLTEAPFASSLQSNFRPSYVPQRIIFNFRFHSTNN